MKATVDSDVGCGPGKGVISTFGGELFDVLNPEPHKIRLGVIAHALSMIPRFGGHANWFYSVAQHSRNCALECEYRYPNNPRLAVICLLHDAAEAYCGDVVRPIKQVIRPLYSPIEEKVQAAVWERFEIEIDDYALEVVDEIDTAVIIKEARVLMHRSDTWGLPNVRPANVSIENTGREWAKKDFIDTYHRFGGLLHE